MKQSQHKAILTELDAFIEKLDQINTENGKDDLKHEHMNLLIDRLTRAFVHFEYNDADLEDD